jgi:MoaA/NifB/PqqE/SkfB family radical SAM enzyme
MNLNNNTDGSMKICCAQNENLHLKKDDGSTFNVATDNIDEVWNSKHMRDIRKKLLNGEQIQECNVCWNVENLEKTYGGHEAPTSTRLDSIKSYMEEDGIYSHMKEVIENNIKMMDDDGFIKDTLNSLELRLGNHCNLKCTMCWGYSSSRINAERLDIVKKYGSKMPVWLYDMWYPAEYNISKINMMWHENPQFLDNFKKVAPTLKRLYVTGGEPSIIKANDDMINHLIEIGNKECHVSFTTNLTTWNINLYEKLSFFDKSEVQVSIDGYKESQEYIRYGSAWEDIETNFKRLVELPDKVRIQIYNVFQIYNMFETYKLMKWLDSLSLKRHVSFWPILIDQPLHLRSNIIPWSLRDKAMELYREFYDYSTYDNKYLDLHGAANRIISYLESDWEAHGSYGKYCQGVEQTEVNQRYMFYQYTNFMDRCRDTDFFKTFIQFEELREEYENSLDKKIVTPNWWIDD